MKGESETSEPLAPQCPKHDQSEAMNDDRDAQPDDRSAPEARAGSLP